jgi:hypothetical protein
MGEAGKRKVFAGDRVALGLADAAQIPQLAQKPFPV